MRKLPVKHQKVAMCFYKFTKVVISRSSPRLFLCSAFLPSPSVASLSLWTSQTRWWSQTSVNNKSPLTTACCPQITSINDTNKATEQGWHTFNVLMMLERRDSELSQTDNNKFQIVISFLIFLLWFVIDICFIKLILLLVLLRIASFGKKTPPKTCIFTVSVVTSSQTWLVTLFPLTLWFTLTKA